MMDNIRIYNTSSLEDEYNSINRDKAWLKVFKNIGEEAVTFPCIEAKKPVNKALNRYRDVKPYDHSRIILKRCENDYINANLITVERANRKYILTQGPLSTTVSHFWAMIWEQNSRAILMLNKIVEKRETKCHWYWPKSTGETHKLVFNDIKITVEQVNESLYQYYIKRLFKITDLESGENREVIQFHYTAWPDFGVPPSPNDFLKFLKEVRLSGALKPDVGPPIVHCSAGIGRSGTFCLVESCLAIFENEGLVNLNVLNVLMEMRRGRMGLIQTPDQLRFSYQAIIAGMEKLSDKQETDTSVEYDVCNDILSNSNEIDETAEGTPPPLPPRIGSMRPSQPNATDYVSYLSPDRPLPDIPNDDDNSSVEDSSTEEKSEPTPAHDPSSSADDEAEEVPLSPSRESGITENVRHRRNRELAERVSAQKRRMRESEKWLEFKRSLYKPVAYTFGAIIAGIAVYAYIKR